MIEDTKNYYYFLRKEEKWERVSKEEFDLCTDESRKICGEEINSTDQLRFPFH